MSSQEWKNKNAVRYNILVLKSSGIPEALQKASEALGQKPTTIVSIALREKLEREGYLASKSETE